MSSHEWCLITHRQHALQVVYEQLGAHSFYAAPAAELAMHKWAADHPGDLVAQSLSGVVLDAGYSFTHAVPIFDGRAQRAAVRRIRLGGKLLTNLLKEWVRRPARPAHHTDALTNPAQVTCLMLPLLPKPAQRLPSSSAVGS